MPSYKQGFVLRERYQVEKEIARGGSAVVYQARDLASPVGERVALKVVEWTRDMQALFKSVKREVQFSATMQHENIVRLLDVFADKSASSLIIVWELVQGPDLLERINQCGAALPEPEAAFYFCQLLRGLLWMHQTGFAHRDLKPENCVLQERTGTVKLIDFGLTKHIESTRTLQVGTPEYMAPEMIKSGPAQGLFSYAGSATPGGGGGSGGGARYDARAVDAWAMGVLFYVLVAAQYPFQDTDGPMTNAVYKNLLNGHFKPLPPSISAGAAAIISGLLRVDPAQRTSLEDVATDPWLLAQAMAYAEPRQLSHLVQPPLAPAPDQVAAAKQATAAAASSPGHAAAGGQRMAAAAAAAPAAAADDDASALAQQQQPVKMATPAAATTEAGAAGSRLPAVRHVQAAAAAAAAAGGDSKAGSAGRHQAQQHTVTPGCGCVCCGKVVDCVIC